MSLICKCTKWAVTVLPFQPALLPSYPHWKRKFTFAKSIYASMYHWNFKSLSNDHELSRIDLWSVIFVRQKRGFFYYFFLFFFYCSIPCSSQFLIFQFGSFNHNNNHEKNRLMFPCSLRYFAKCSLVLQKPLGDPHWSRSTQDLELLTGLLPVIFRFISIL